MTACRRAMRRLASCGFTLIELVMVIVILGILGVAVLPRMMDRQTFDARGYFDQTKATIRYAQKLAIAQRRNVFVNVTANALCLTYVADVLCTNINAADIVLSPSDNQRYYKLAPSGVSFNAAASFSFSPLGRPSAGAVVIGVVGDGSTRNIVVENETGYVH